MDFKIGFTMTEKALQTVLGSKTNLEFTFGCLFATSL